MKFPIFVLLKDCGEVEKYPSIHAMQAELEAIDIENHEYLAWDADGIGLELGTQKPVWITIEEKTKDWGSLVDAVRAFAASEKSETRSELSSVADIEEVLKSITAKKSTGWWKFRKS